MRRKAIQTTAAIAVAQIELNVPIYADSVGWLPYNRLDRLDRPSPLKMCSGNGHDHLELTALITDATLLGRLQSPGQNLYTGYFPYYRPDNLDRPNRRVQRKQCPIGPGLVDFAIGLENSVINFLRRTRNSNYRSTVKSICSSKRFWGQLKRCLGSFGLVNVSFSLLEWQAVKMTFFAPCNRPKN